MTLLTEGEATSTVEMGPLLVQEINSTPACCHNQSQGTVEGPREWVDNVANNGKNFEVAGIWYEFDRLLHLHLLLHRICDKTRLLL